MNAPAAPHTRHLPFMVPGMLILLFAAWTGLIRMGWRLPLLEALSPLEHGPLMVSGFLGTLISLERAAALGTRWSYAPPVLTLLGALALLLGLPDPVGPLLMTLGSAGLLLVFVHIVRRHPATYTVTMALGSAVWFVGNVLWMLEWPVSAAVPWWMGFLILTIVGERLELSRVMRPPRSAHLTFAGATLLFLAGLLLSLVNLDGGIRLLGVTMVALVLWLSRWDVTRHTLRRRGMVRYIAVCMVAGYVWLLVGGVLALRVGDVRAGLLYDALLHSVFLGFVFSMIFGHALIIFPALLGVALPYRALFYLPLALLHGSLALRVTADLLGWFDGRLAGGLLNAIAILFFLLTVLRTMLPGLRARRRKPAAGPPKPIAGAPEAIVRTP